MKTWKPWQLVFLIYLLGLNLLVFCALGYFLLGNNFLSTPHQPPQSAAAAQVTPTSTQPPAAQPPNPAHTPTPTLESIPPVDIPPVPPPANTTATEPTPTATPPATAVAQLNPTSTGPPTSVPTSTPTHTPTLVPTSTPSSTPTSTSTSTATHTPSPTASATNTATGTPSPTQTATPTPRPTRTPTLTPQPTFTATATPQPTAIRTPNPTAIPTKTVTPSPQPTRTPTPNPTKTPTPTAAPQLAQGAAPAVASALSTVDSNGGGSTLAQPAAPGALALMDAVPLTNGNIALSWKPVNKTRQYRIYSDMGSGFGVYVYKARTTQPTFIDTLLRPGTTYSYRLTHLQAEQEVVLAQVKTSTFANNTLAQIDSAGEPQASAASVVAAPTALPSDAVLLGLVSDNNFTDEFNTLTIVGEVRNDSNLDVGQTDITVTFYNAAGTVIGTASGQTLLETIPPGEKSPFLINLTRPPGLATYSLRAVARPVTPNQGAQLSVVEVKRFEDEAGFFHIKGQIENVGNVVAKRTKVAAVIYGRYSNVINVGFTYVTPPNLAPGERATYDVIFAYYPRYLTQQVIPFEE